MHAWRRFRQSRHHFQGMDHREGDHHSTVDSHKQERDAVQKLAHRSRHVTALHPADEAIQQECDEAQDDEENGRQQTATQKFEKILDSAHDVDEFVVPVDHGAETRGTKPS